ncbi:hypothetical protein CC78DRAFT_581090 [Lojkania enalia]|uniref:Uncharacterized protein n=1 Tax=Lojkania enalia TaxID=147567 RepID=A0A9P4KC21_9PLEO|nr:hypothetical protein CC78DRAFT_581090 [Didymosphaeria enalia]
MAPSTSKTGTPKAKATNGGVKKAGRPKGPGAKKANAKNAMLKMQAFFKANRSQFKDLSFKDQQKELGKKVLRPVLEASASINLKLGKHLNVADFALYRTFTDLFESTGITLLIHQPSSVSKRKASTLHVNTHVKP